MLNNFERLLLIRGVSIFRELRDDFLIRLSAVMEEKQYTPKQAIIQQGEDGNSMFIVAQGRVRIHAGSQELIQFGRGDFFGEMSLFDREPRSATATPIEACSCLELTQQQLYEAIQETPEIAFKLIGVLSGRIRDLNEELRHFKQEIDRIQRTPTFDELPTVSSAQKKPQGKRA
ncbi:MAG: cyclic nucleotide-binding domain-containing protein [Alkalinema sp. RU_4_3]|nr:cyclic nucleotide-binding domain-containing protein [Alkalinema sp. RU_4_3]